MPLFLHRSEKTYAKQTLILITQHPAKKTTLSHYTLCHWMHDNSWYHDIF